MSGEIVIDHSTLYSPKIYLEQLPGDSIWNYQHVFPDRTPSQEPPAKRRLILLNDARIVNGLTVVPIGRTSGGRLVAPAAVAHRAAGALTPARRSTPTVPSAQ